MAISLTVKGVTYIYPETDNEDWGDQATQWAQSVTNAISPLKTNPTAPVANAGVLTLGNTDRISWRDSTDTNDAGLFLGADDKLWVELPDGSLIDVSTLGTGDVHGPASSVDNTIPRYDSITGKFIKTSGIVIADDDSVSGINVATANTFVGDFTGDLTGNVTGNLSGNVAATLANVTTLNVAQIDGNPTIDTLKFSTSLPSANTPALNTEYANSILKARALAYPDSNTVVDAFNIQSITFSGPTATVTMRRALADVNYQAVVNYAFNPSGGIPNDLAAVLTAYPVSNTVFTITKFDTAGGTLDWDTSASRREKISILVFGN